MHALKDGSSVDEVVIIATGVTITEESSSRKSSSSEVDVVGRRPKQEGYKEIVKAGTKSYS